MKETDFQLISNDSMSRGPLPVKKILSEGEVFFDVHCHVFNYRDVPDKFLGIRVHQNEQLLSYLEKVLNRIINGSDNYMVLTEGHFRFLKTSFVSTMGDELMKKIAKENPLRFLFG